MLENKLVDGDGPDPMTSSAENRDAVLWDLRMLEGGLGLENVAYPGHYLMVAILGSKTVLFSHDIRTAPTRSYVEGLLRMQEAAASGSGSGDSTETPTEESTTTSTEAVTAAPEETTAITEGEEEELIVLSSWQFETLGMALSRFQATSSTHDCFLAVGSNGQPEPNLCAVPENDYRVPVYFFPHSNTN